MRTLAHISDLHFGTEAANIAGGLIEHLVLAGPDLVVVSGDLTQRAKPEQFREARLFLDSIPFPKIIVPGNHDVPLLCLARRFLSPLARYRAIVTRDLAPFWLDSEIAVLGINTARSLTWKNGRVSVEQMDLIRERFCSIPGEVFKVLVTHHPFIPPPGLDRESVVGRAEQTLLAIQGCSPDLALAGHFHMSYSAGSHSVYTGLEGSMMVVQAGTAISRRTRDEQNAFNILRIDRGEVELRVCEWNGERFEERRRKNFNRKAGRWETRDEPLGLADV